MQRWVQRIGCLCWRFLSRALSWWCRSWEQKKSSKSSIKVLGVEVMVLPVDHSMEMENMQRILEDWSSNSEECNAGSSGASVKVQCQKIASRFLRTLTSWILTGERSEMRLHRGDKEWLRFMHLGMFHPAVSFLCKGYTYRAGKQSPLCIKFQCLTARGTLFPQGKDSFVVQRVLFIIVVRLSTSFS
jgi:hypothetical protein